MMRRVSGTRAGFILPTVLLLITVATVVLVYVVRLHGTLIRTTQARVVQSELRMIEQSLVQAMRAGMFDVWVAKRVDNPAVRFKPEELRNVLERANAFMSKWQVSDAGSGGALRMTARDAAGFNGEVWIEMEPTFGAASFESQTIAQAGSWLDGTVGEVCRLPFRLTVTVTNVPGLPGGASHAAERTLLLCAVPQAGLALRADSGFANRGALNPGETVVAQGATVLRGGADARLRVEGSATLSGEVGPDVRQAGRETALGDFIDEGQFRVNTEQREFRRRSNVVRSPERQRVEGLTQWSDEKELAHLPGQINGSHPDAGEVEFEEICREVQAWYATPAEGRVFLDEVGLSGGRPTYAVRDYKSVVGHDEHSSLTSLPGWVTVRRLPAGATGAPTVLVILRLDGLPAAVSDVFVAARSRGAGGTHGPVYGDAVVGIADGDLLDRAIRVTTPNRLVLLGEVNPLGSAPLALNAPLVATGLGQLDAAAINGAGAGGRKLGATLGLMSLAQHAGGPHAANHMSKSIVQKAVDEGQVAAHPSHYYGRGRGMSYVVLLEAP